MKTVSKTPVIQAPSSTGKVKNWFAKVVEDKSSFYIITESWTVNKSGEESKHLVSAPVLVKGKNVGKKNETTDKEQAIFDMGVKKRKKLDEGYSDGDVVLEKDRDFILPMLAHKFHERGKDIKFPVALQPKLNGMRCLYDGETHCGLS